MHDDHANRIGDGSHAHIASHNCFRTVRMPRRYSRGPPEGSEALDHAARSNGGRTNKKAVAIIARGGVTVLMLIAMLVILLATRDRDSTRSRGTGVGVALIVLIVVLVGVLVKRMVLSRCTCFVMMLACF